MNKDNMAKILVIDDEPQVTEIVEAFLKIKDKLFKEAG